VPGDAEGCLGRDDAGIQTAETRDSCSTSFQLKGTGHLIESLLMSCESRLG